MDLSSNLELAQGLAVTFGAKLLGAIALWWAGRLLINLAQKLIRRALTARQIDPTLQSYLASILTVVLNLVLVIGLLGFFGVETTSFAALIAALGVAIGAAWAGLLSNFAAGAFIVMLRPYKVGDSIEAGGAVGRVEEIGLFSTRILSADNVITLVGNAKILGDNVKNFTATRYRLVERPLVVPADRPLHDTVALLRTRLAAIPHVLAEPGPVIAPVDVQPDGVLVSLRVAALPDHHAQVVDEVNRVVVEQFGPVA
ncbi:MAG: mechanosensitive ion channel family protein [Burkholderiaceae bacterium]